MVQWNMILGIFLVLFCLCMIIRFTLTQLNIRHVRKKGHTVPPVFHGIIDDDTLGRMSDYTVDSSRFASFTSIFDDILFLIILLSGILPWYARLIAGLDWHFIPSGLLFMAGPAAIGFLLDIPFDIYGTFVIEKRYGFSTITAKLWITDLVKNLMLSMVLIGLLLGAFLALVYYAEKTWWFWGWLLFALFQLVMLWLYPVLIAPLFNKYEPVKNDELREKIVSLMAEAGLRAKGVFQVDSGKRSRHTNAYFTGFGKSKRVVLFDTLIASHSIDEILSVFAHEIGHWKKKHISKQLVAIETVSFFLFYIAYRLIDWAPLYHTFGFDSLTSYVGLFLLSAYLRPVSFFFKPLWASLSRKYEREADDYSLSLIGTTVHLADALKRLAKDNLANLHPHPLYTWFYYSHPPLTDRVSYLEKRNGKGVVDF